jgi:HD-GYP domain-containing protein (c-di-GMP phosphodiesterase class II)
VARIAVAIGTELGFSPESCHVMHRGALLHDIGLLAISDSLVNAPGPLQPDVFDGIKAHPVVGYEMLKSVPSLQPVLPYIRHHHERIDGSGFPDGLSRSEIPFHVQIVAIADAWDALRSPRSYRKVFSHLAAMDVVREETERGLWDRELFAPLERAVGAAGIS